jgi:hypothetical protein
MEEIELEMDRVGRRWWWVGDESNHYIHLGF